MRGGAVRCALLLTFSFLCWLLFPSAALAQYSATSISFQGVLNGANGQRLPNGNYTLVFRFYDSPITNQWRYATTNEGVAVADGVASTAIAVDPSIFDGTTRYLGITVPGFDGGQELTPRVLVTTVPYAIKALKAGDIGENLSLQGKLEANGGFLSIGPNGQIRLRPELPAFQVNRRDGYGLLGSDDNGGYLHLAHNSPGAPAYVRAHILNDQRGEVRVLDGNNNEVLIRGDGLVRTKILQITGGSDLAEPFDVTAPSADTPIVPGMVMVIDRERDGKLTPCAQAYDTAVAGILSGAKGLQPGMVMKAEGQPHAEGEHPLAMTGRVWCLADAAHSPIQRGDRLTTSPAVGHAMKAADEARAPGAVLGKAVSELREGRGFVLVLVNLQ